MLDERLRLRARVRRSGVSVTRESDPALLDALVRSPVIAREIVRGGEGATKLVTVGSAVRLLVPMPGWPHGRSPIRRS
jgi:hypothetical protein